MKKGKSQTPHHRTKKCVIFHAIASHALDVNLSVEVLQIKGQEVELGVVEREVFEWYFGLVALLKFLEVAERTLAMIASRKGYVSEVLGDQLWSIHAVSFRR